ncbi:MAG: ribbon-helix-helix domain-containing protein [Candidatus Methanoperedens sp.]|nr:ribbon-helix-helix domain-containing protein [Candidatus Methanoperedens sp.]
MGEITIHLPSDLETGIENLVSQGIYKSREDAIIALIRTGLSALKKREEPKVHPIPEYPPIPPFKPPEKWPDHYGFKK